MKFVIFHGSLGSPDGNWFPDLKKKLEFMGQTVISPQFPIDNESTLKKGQKTIQSLESWTKTFEQQVLPNITDGEKLCFIGHSLANVFILHMVEKFKIKLDCAIFVSPFLDRLSPKDWKYDLVNSTFYKTDFNYEKLIKYIPVSYVLYSDTDPYVSTSKALHFAKVMQSSQIMVRKAGHMGSSVNMNEFPLVYDLCMTRLDLTLYQKFEYEKALHDTLKRLTFSDRKVIKLTPQETNDEGTFHALNLSRGGFATFISNAENWNVKDEYFENARRVAKGGADITRVFIIVNKSDLKRKVLRDQMKLDIKAGINVYTIDYEHIKEINCEEDFGIWDNEYVCILHRDKEGKLLECLIDSRVKSLLTAQNWRDRILRKSNRITDLKELDI